jgi:hypothetical protein
MVREGWLGARGYSGDSGADLTAALRESVEPGTREYKLRGAAIKARLAKPSALNHNQSDPRP